MVKYIDLENDYIEVTKDDLKLYVDCDYFGLLEKGFKIYKPKGNGSYIFKCIKGHIANCYSGFSQKLGCIVCRTGNSSAGEALKKLNDKRGRQ